MGFWAASHGFAVTAETVIFGIGDEAGAHGVQIDVGGHRFEDLALALDEDGFEALGPEGAVAVVRAVEPDGEALLEELHELGDVAHHGELALAPSFALGIAGLEPGDDDIQASLLEAGGLGVEHRITAQEFGVGDLGDFRDAEEDVEVISIFNPSLIQLSLINVRF